MPDYDPKREYRPHERWFRGHVRRADGAVRHSGFRLDENGCPAEIITVPDAGRLAWLLCEADARDHLNGKAPACPPPPTT